MNTEPDLSPLRGGMAAEQRSAWSLWGILSIVASCGAYVLTFLPYLGMKSMLLFYFFAPWVRMLGGSVGVLLGIIAVVQAGSWFRAKVGFIGIALGVTAFALAFYLGLRSV